MMTTATASAEWTETSPESGDRKGNMDTAIELTRSRKALWRRCLRKTRAWFRLQMWQHIRETYHIGDHTHGP